ncbi:TetR/AcrR family transcriptional regulator [Haliangium sp.]|uniref:TetR/AcrR family transcriptional regulator n=1 Tax=Haliangium sp. TaxID=2663208 RepID=UPI003D0FD466
MFNFSEADQSESEEGGLRARKKRQTRRAIVEAALGLMSAHGYEATTMEQVAREAEVSVGSLYNYFATKQALLLGVVGHATGDLIGAGRAVLDAPPEDARAGVFRLLHAYVDALGDLDKDLLKRALGVSFTEPFEMSEELVRLDMAMIEQLGELVAGFQDRGSITDEVSSEQAAVSLYGTFCISVLMWVSLPEQTTRELTNTLDDQLAVVFRGLEPRRRTRRRR